MLTSEQGPAARVSDPEKRLLDVIAARIAAADNGHVQAVICFGSRANGGAHDKSDVDILVVVDSVPGWDAKRNVTESRRLASAILPLPCRLDLWVRTTDQYAEARDVIGGYEYSASVTGVELSSRALRTLPARRRSFDDIRYGNVCDWLELSRRLLGRSVQLATVSFIREGRWLSPEHYAWRACMSAMGALFVWRQIGIPSKYDDLREWLRRISEFDSEASSTLASVFETTPSGPHLAHAVLRTVAAHLSSDARLRTRTQELKAYLSQPVGSLGAVPSLR